MYINQLFNFRYFKLCNLLNYEHFENVVRLPWSHSFERFLQCQPTCKEDQKLLANLLNFLHLYIKFTNSGIFFYQAYNC